MIKKLISIIDFVGFHCLFIMAIPIIMIKGAITEPITIYKNIYVRVKELDEYNKGLKKNVKKI